MRLLFICNEYPPTKHGGVGTFVFTLANHLNLDGYDVHVIGFDESIKQSVRRDQQGIHVTRLLSPFKNRKYLRWGRYDAATQILERIYLSQQVRRYCQQHEIDLVESYDWSGPLWFHPGPPLLVRMHGAHLAYAFYEKRRSPRLITYLEKRNLRMADALVGVSCHIGQVTLRAAGLEDRTFDVIYNGVDTSVFHPLNSMERSDGEVLFAGTVSRRKGIHELFDAIPIVLQAVPQAHFTIVGRLPSEEHSRKKLMDELMARIPPGQQHVVTFTDVRPYDEMPQWYSRAACAVFPSLAEAYGLTCAEAMACGAPVVMTSGASGPEIVEDGISGLLREPTSTNALADAIIALLLDTELRTRLSSKGRDRIQEKFEINKVVQKNLAVYERLISYERR